MALTVLAALAIICAALAAGFACALRMLDRPRLPSASGWARYRPGEGVEITEGPTARPPARPPECTYFETAWK